MRMFPALLALLLAACVGNTRQSETAYFDFGGASLVWKPGVLPVRGVGVFAPSWLGTTAMQYRLLYTDSMRRQNFADSRWAAPPAELLERLLNRQTGSGANGCRLRIDLDELVQVFDTAQSSQILLEVRASLMGPQHDAILARKSFALTNAAASPDARGGVAGAVTAVQALGGELGSWLSGLARDNPKLKERCEGVAP